MSAWYASTSRPASRSSRLSWACSLSASVCWLTFPPSVVLGRITELGKQHLWIAEELLNMAPDCCL